MGNKSSLLLTYTSFLLSDFFFVCLPFVHRFCIVNIYLVILMRFTIITFEPKGFITLKLMFSTLREERNQTQVLRQQQDEAYLASLRADQEKDRKKREEQEQLRQEEEKVRQTALAEERRRRVSLIFY